MKSARLTHANCLIMASRAMPGRPACRAEYCWAAVHAVIICALSLSSSVFLVMALNAPTRAASAVCDEGRRPAVVPLSTHIAAQLVLGFTALAQATVIGVPRLVTCGRNIVGRHWQGHREHAITMAEFGACTITTSVAVFCTPYIQLTAAECAWPALDAFAIAAAVYVGVSFVAHLLGTCRWQARPTASPAAILAYAANRTAQRPVMTTSGDDSGGSATEDGAVVVYLNDVRHPLHVHRTLQSLSRYEFCADKTTGGAVGVGGGATAGVPGQQLGSFTDTSAAATSAILVAAPVAAAAAGTPADVVPAMLVIRPAPVQPSRPASTGIHVVTNPHTAVTAPDSLPSARVATRLPVISPRDLLTPTSRRNPAAAAAASAPECAICMQEYEEGDVIVRLQCSDKHAFHQECIKDWMLQSMVCPLCRGPIVAPVPPTRSNSLRAGAAARDTASGTSGRDPRLAPRSVPRDTSQ